jgi:hypothetical protein
MEPLVKPLTILAFLCGHILDTKILKSSNGTHFAKSWWWLLRRAVVAMLVTATSTITTFYCIKYNVR